MAKGLIDTADIKVAAGNGGDGAVSFYRAKYLPKGGPDGGDGGKGGDVYMLADHNMATLIDFRAKPKYHASNGKSGMGRNMSGEDGEDTIIKVPVGTLIYEKVAEGEKLIADMNEDGLKVMIAAGGIGGRGNYVFRSSTNQTPYQYTKGIPGQQKALKLEIKLIADIGIVGAPNAGKSTLINALTNANAKVANYPFTTISPNLGVLALKSGENVVLSDIPGLIEGASQGKGLGDDFLRHIERTRMLIHLIDAFPEELTSQDYSDLHLYVKNALAKYVAIQSELQAYKIDLTKKPQLVVINKLDITEIKQVFPEIVREFAQRFNVDVLGISAVTKEGTDTLIIKLMELLEKNPRVIVHSVEKPIKTYTLANLPNKRVVYNENRVVEREYRSTRF